MKTLHVLIVDTQNKLSAEYLHTYSPHKFQVENNVENAISRMQSIDYDLVVATTQLPDADLLLLRSMTSRQLPDAVLNVTEVRDNKALMRMANEVALQQSPRHERKVEVMDNTFELEGLRTD
ncbi:MAG: hypothetical protein ACOYJF_02540 [Prevotella sp.]|jgi:DNA-binding response OmpR family regulator